MTDTTRLRSEAVMPLLKGILDTRQRGELKKT